MDILFSFLCYGFVIYSYIGRYSPVRRASEGSKHQPLIHGPLQECQQLIQQQKGLAHRNLSLTQSPPLLDTSSLPGMPSITMIL